MRVLTLKDVLDGITTSDVDQHAQAIGPHFSTPCSKRAGELVWAVMGNLLLRLSGLLYQFCSWYGTCITLGERVVLQGEMYSERS
jgi:hypothetical protein